MYLKIQRFFAKKAHISDINGKPVVENRGKSEEKPDHCGKNLPPS